jgi:hypothetical protein
MKYLPIFRRLRKVWKAIAGFAISAVCLSVYMEQLGPHLADFHKIWYLSIFRNHIGKTQVILKSFKNNMYFTWRPIHFYNNISFNSSYNVKICRENKNTHFIFYNFFSRKSRRFWDNVEKYGGAKQATYGNITRRMRFACWITETTHTLTHTQNKQYLLFFRGSNGYMNAPHCYIIRILPVLFSTFLHISFSFEH